VGEQDAVIRIALAQGRDQGLRGAGFADRYRVQPDGYAKRYPLVGRRWRYGTKHAKSFAPVAQIFRLPAGAPEQMQDRPGQQGQHGEGVDEACHQSNGSAAARTCSTLGG
jgi:hypothetical protein